MYLIAVFVAMPARNGIFFFFRAVIYQEASFNINRVQHNFHRFPPSFFHNDVKINLYYDGFSLFYFCFLYFYDHLIR